MAELEQQNAPSDPLASLHKMSTTAGIVSADYVAISNMAVFSAVLGAATALAIIWWQLALVAVAGVLLGVLALRSISRSNGTLSGRAVAAAGIILSIGFAATGAGLEYARWAALVPDKKAIDARLTSLGELIMKGEYQSAYKQFDPAWREKANFDKFEQGMLNLQHPSYGGKVTKFEPNNLFYFYTAGGSRMCVTKARITFKKGDLEIPMMMHLRQQPDGQWLIIYSEMFRDIDPFETQKKTQSNQPLSK